MNNKTKLTMRKFIVVLSLFACSCVTFAQSGGIIVVSTEQQKAQRFFNQALSSFQQKKYDSSLIYLDNTLKINANMGDAYILKANVQQEMGQLQNAVATWLVFADKTGKKDSAYYMVSKLYYDNADYESSLKYAQLAINIKDSDYKTHYLKGLSNYHLEKQEDAIADFTTAITLKETVSELYNDRGNAYCKAKNYQQAIEDYTQAIRIKSISPYFNNRANAEYQLGNYLQAIDDYTTAIQLDRNNYLLFCNRGIAKLALTEYQDALEDFHACIQLNNNFLNGYNYRGIAYFKLKRYEDAMSDFNKVISINPESAEAYLHRGNTYEMLRNPQKACQDWQQASEMGVEKANDYINNQCK